MNTNICLNDLEVGQVGIITKLLAKGSNKRRFLDIGLVDDTTVECVLQSPSKDPKAFLIRGAIIALRDEDCKSILIQRDELCYGAN